MFMDKFFPMPLFEGEGGGAGDGDGDLGGALNRGGPGEGDKPPGSGDKPPAGGGNEPFHASFQDEELARMSERWETPEAMAKSYRELETMMSGKMDGYIKMPGEGATPDEVNAFQTSMGRPEAAENYEIPQLKNLPEGDTTPQWFTQIAHKVGLNQDQYNNIMTAYDELIEETELQADTAYEEKARQGNEALKDKWGSDYAQKVAVGNRAVKHLDLQQEEIVALADVLGVERSTEIFVGIGALVGSDQSVMDGGDGSSAPFSGDAAWAQSELTKLTNNAEFMKKAANPAMNLNDPSFKPLLDRYNRCNDILSKAKAGIS